MKKLISILSVCALCLICYSANARMNAATTLGGGVPVTASSGTVGQGTPQDNGYNIPNNVAWFTRSVVGAGNGGSVRYAHLHMNGFSNSTDVICISLQADSDGGTVHLSASGNPSGDLGWFNLDMGSSFTILEGITYRLVVQSSSGTWINGGSFGSTPRIQNDTTWSYSCGASVTVDADGENRTMYIIFNNTSGDPT
jgi:hypothetical protein